jgi:tetratricopeptide (TPR) repeat protein
MSDPLRTDPSRAGDGAPDPDRDGKIEQLLLLGLDHYFSGEYEHAINVWTRALFLDRNHARARAYIERARTALAERLRRSEELLHDGVAACHRGEGDEARRLLEAALDQGAPSDQALAALERLNRLERSAVASLAPVATRPPAARGWSVRSGLGSGAGSGRVGWIAGLVIVAAAAAIIAAPDLVEWVAALPPPAPPAPSAIAAGVERTMPLPRRAETVLARARALAASGHLYDALGILDQIRLTDPERPEADRLRGEIQRQLVAVSGVLP